MMVRVNVNMCPHCRHVMDGKMPRVCPNCRHVIEVKPLRRPDTVLRPASAVKEPKPGNKLTLGGTLFLRNGVERDYCFEQTLEGMVAVCDQIALVECHSTDGTLEMLQKWKDRYPDKIKLEQRDWKPCAGGLWLRDLTNEARMMLTTDMHLLMGADEAIHPEQYGLVKEMCQTGRMVQFRRYNFRASAWHITPMDRGGGGDYFRRMGPVEVPAECDGGDLENWPKTIHAAESGLVLYHYGQARTADGFVKKSREMLGAYYGPPGDNLLDEVQEHGIKMLCESKSGTAIPWEDMVPFEGEHPPCMVPWLRERGYEV